MASGEIVIIDPNGGEVKVISFDSNDIVCAPDEMVKFHYCPPELLKNTPVIFKVVETGPPDNKEKLAVDIRAAS